jgi:hypothetical protein
MARKLGQIEQNVRAMQGDIQQIRGGIAQLMRQQAFTDSAYQPLPPDPPPPEYNNNFNEKPSTHI